ncbi:hypothetical protein DFH07DRAFT_784929 [Mycena maculata]|uniref:Uncharacterized protein n=1 Tax=Mycena maculata TaxID=230809 RepID=A0AAD7MIX5_9AGAR|nr:hypothetical protein DFH07DRAFT_784929 [Mycena maculata]
MSVMTELPPSSPPPGTESLKPPSRRPILPGMENGYAMSPMGQLRIQYNQDSEEDSALRKRITILVSKFELSSKDISDRGVSTSGAFSRFTLETGFSLRLRGLVSEFQTLLIAAADLIPERKESGRHFIIDPRNTLMGILGGAESLDEMTLAWKALRSRLELAQDYLEKYHVEYQAVMDAELLMSPASTDVVLYEGLENFANSTSMNTWAPTSDSLKAAFPERDVEERPSTVYYSTEGERRERELPEGSSWRASEDFTPPEMEIKTRSRKKVSIVEVPEEESEAEKSFERKLDETGAYPRIDSSSTISEDGKNKRGEPASAYSRIGSNTPFKKDIFPVNRSGGRPSDALPVPNPNLPNPIQGMASSSTRFQTVGESISQAVRSSQDPLANFRWSGNPSIPVGPTPMRFDPNVRRDLPPHLSERTTEEPEDREDPDRGGSGNGEFGSGSRVPMGNPNPDPGGDPSDSGDDDCGGPRDPDPPRRSNPPPRRGNRHPPPTGNPRGFPGGGSPGHPGGGGPPPGGGGPPPRGQLANLEGWLPEALGFWLPSRLKKGSAIYLWFSIQSARKQGEMRSHYLEYLNVIKDEFLGRKWQILMNLEFQRQSFRQSGHTDETPQQFIGRCIQYTRILAEGDDGGPMEVFLVMRNAPLKWNTILVLDNIYSTSQMYSKVSEHEDTLIEAAKRDQTDVITSYNLLSALRKVGVKVESPRGNNWNHRANLAAIEEESVEEMPPEKATSDLIPPEEESDEDVIVLKQVYNTFKKRQRPPPKGGYPYP